jgi:beta-fructofuranosidase
MTAREQQLINAAYAEVKKHQETVESDYYRLKYHIMPPVGLLNDPNGFIQFNDTYHLFYQWNPFKTGHGAKFWGHYTSTDLIHWNHEEIALAPSEWFEKNGCYSGSAVEHDGKMLLYYTGNVKDEEGNRESYQCLAISEDGMHFDKKGPVVNLPEQGYTAHFRDPKVWEKDGKWYMVIGAQSEAEEGKVVLYRSANLTDWELLGEMTGSNSEQLDEFGYMWECPDLISLDGKDVLIVSPQGLEPEGDLYNNLYQAGYFVGRLNYENAKFSHGEFNELDRGFEFYAPQTTEDVKGRRLLFGWMGMPEENEEDHPTIEHGWIHTMTLPRELKLMNDKLYQIPVEELTELRQREVTVENAKLSQELQSFDGIDGDSLELLITSSDDLAFSMEINIRNNAKVLYNADEKKLSLERISFANGKWERRSCQLDSLSEMRIFLDTSSIEVFANGGEEVFTARIYPEKSNKKISFSGQGNILIKKWELSL